jgi:hypothetical protein
MGILRDVVYVDTRVNDILKSAYRAADDLSVVEESDIKNLDVRVYDSDDLASARNLSKDYRYGSHSHQKRCRGAS